MKNFDPMNSGDDVDFERQLRAMELRLPPAEWKTLLLPPPPTPWFPKPFVTALAICWAVTGVLILITPQGESLGPPLILPPPPPPSEEFLLTYNQSP